jgi:phage recombination protein Bet
MTQPQSKSLSIHHGGVPKRLEQDQIEILRETVFKGLSNEQIKFAVEVCNRTQLDPFLRQIHFVPRRDRKTGKDVIAIQVGIDGFRLEAQRSGAYAGSDDPVFDDERQPTKATVTVYRMVAGQRCSFTATVRWNEFYPGDGPQAFMWKTKPCVMLGKCAEAQALRKGFPAELSGMYEPAEMERDDHAAVEEKTQAKAKAVNALLDEPEVLDAEEPSPGDVVFSWGRMKGTRLADLSRDDRDSFVSKYRAQESQGQQLGGEVLAMVVACEKLAEWEDRKAME